MSEAPSIIVRMAPAGDGFDCVIRPAPVWLPLDRESLPTYRQARRAADCLKVVHPDWKLVDQVPAKRRAAA
jgi:hypothetical protein